MSQIVRHYVLLVAVAAVVFFTNLGGPRLWDRDETLNARCTVEMLERGDWVVPHYNGWLRYMKPAAMYWFMMSAVGVFGPSEFAFRFWSAVAGIGTVLATYHIGRRLFHPEAGLWAAIALATSLMFAVLSRTVKADALMILFDTLAILVFVWAVFRPADRPDDATAGPRLRFPGRYYPQSIGTVAAMFALMGFAVLLKGPIGVVLPTAVIGMFLLIVRPASDNGSGIGLCSEPALRWQFGPLALTGLWLGICLFVFRLSVELGVVALSLLALHLLVRRLPIFRPFAPGHFLSTCWSMRPITAILAAGAVALPWHVWVALRDFQWIEGFYWVNNVERATTALEGHGGSGLLFYPGAVAVGFLPWSVFLAPLIIDWVRRIRRDDPWRAGYIFLACWLGVYVVLFSLARTKLPNYVVPAFPALALATGGYLYHLRRSTAATATWWPQVAVVVLGASGLATAIGLAVAAHVFLPGDEWLGLVGLIPIAGAAICFVLFRHGRPRAATTTFAVSALILVVALLAGVTQEVSRRQQIHILIAETTDRSSNPEIAAFGRLEPSWVFYSRRNFRLFGEGNRKQLPRFLADRPDRFLLTTADTYRNLQRELPAGVCELARVPFFLRNGELVLVGHPQVDRNGSEITSRLLFSPHHDPLPRYSLRGGGEETKDEVISEPLHSEVAKLPADGVSKH